MKWTSIQTITATILALFILPACGESRDENQDNQATSRVEIRSIEILDDGEVILDAQRNHWLGAPLVLMEGVKREFSVRFFDAAGEELGIRVGEDGYLLNVSEHGGPILNLEGGGAYFSITPVESGETGLYIGLYLNQELIFEAPDLTVVVEPDSMNDPENCEHPRFAAPECIECLPGFIGEECDECEDPRFEGENCEECADPRFTGESCTQCVDPRFAGGECEDCASGFTGEECDECVDPRFVGEFCDECAPGFTGDGCETCEDPRFAGEACDECAPGFTGDGCETCENSALTGMYCDQCVNPDHGGQECNQCLDPGHHFPNCDRCDPIGFAFPDCTECSQNRGGDLCDEPIYQELYISGSTFVGHMADTNQMGLWNMGYGTQVYYDFWRVWAGPSNHCGVHQSWGTQPMFRCWGFTSVVTDSPSWIPVELSVAHGFACAVRDDESLHCWGFDVESDGEPVGRLDAPGSGAWKNVSVLGNHGCAIADDDTVSCWGSNSHGQTDVPLGVEFSKVSVGETFSCGIRTDETLECWGDSTDGRNAPPSGAFVALDTGDDSACALDDMGEAQCWGSYPGTQTPAEGPFSMIAVGRNFACGLLTDGRARCWGSSSAPPGISDLPSVF